MESAHSRQVGGESFRVSGLKLLDKQSDVRCNDFLGGLRLGRRVNRSDAVGGVVAGFVRSGDAAHGVSPPVLNGCAVFAHKHTLALAHASGGGKCKLWEKWPGKGQPKARGSESLELHGAFSICLRAPEAEPLSRSGYLALGALARKRLLWPLFALRVGVADRNKPAEMGAGRRRLNRRLGKEDPLPPS